VKDLLLKRTERIRTFFTIARFDPDSWFFYGLLGAFATVFYTFGFWYFAAVPLGAAGMIFTVEAFEAIQLEKPEDRRLKLVGETCFVVRRISKSERGVVAFSDPASGMHSWELWSAESQYLLGEGRTALISDIKGITVIVEPA
jgi:membrane protein implicated in regulation of membrane protease activity